MKFKLVIHVNEPERWAIAISNITNFLNDVGDDNAEVVVVANGAGVKGYMREEAPHAKMKGEVCAIGIDDTITVMNNLSKRGVAFLACNNALNSQNIRPESLLGFVKVVPAGVTEMVKLQSEGFAYIKP